MPISQIMQDPAIGSSQNTQITRETEIRDRLGEASATPTADTLNHRLLTLLTRFGDAVASPVANTLLARIQTLIGNFGNVADTAAASPTSNVSFISLFKWLTSNFNTRIPTLSLNGSRLMVDVANATAATSAAGVNTLSTSAATLVAANSSRKGLSFYNPLAVTVFVDTVAAVTTTNYRFQLPPGAYYEHPMGDSPYTGLFYAILPSGTGSLLVREDS